MEITGTSTSRLSELRKYIRSDDFSVQYRSYGGISTDGVDYENSVAGELIKYFIGGIEYTDTIDDGITITEFRFTVSDNNNDFIDGCLIKRDINEGNMNKAKFDSDVFINRFELSAFEKNYRLEYVKSVIELESFAGGNYFKIIKRT